ncbi:hypothetical protein BRD18_08505 [Halobacteriales archaeon SW_7_71_33]|nr:MAG: hypothetical protein BRD18_08505 [Halobacteriales archaeon SW_7_71_33]
MSRPSLRERVTGESDRPDVLVVGEGHVTVALLEELTEVSLTAVTDDPVVARHVAADDRSVTVVEGDPSTAETLRAADAGSADLAVVTLGTDARTMLVARLLRGRFDADVVSTVGDPAVGSTADIETVCVPEAVTERLGGLLEERYSLFE